VAAAFNLRSRGQGRAATNHFSHRQQQQPDQRVLRSAGSRQSGVGAPGPACWRRSSAVARCRRRSKIRTAEQKQALAEYARAGLRAFNDVESALSSEVTLQAARATAREGGRRPRTCPRICPPALPASARSICAPWSQQQLALFAAQATLLRVQSEARVQRVNLHLALAGNFADGNEARATPRPNR